MKECKKGIVDIHSHMLYGVDDGAKDYETTQKMLRMSYEEGCRHLFLTPHAYCLEHAIVNITERICRIREWLDEQNMDLRIYQGAEIYVDPVDENDARSILEKIQTGIYPSLNGTQYVLIEFQLGGFRLEKVMMAVEALLKAGYIPVIAHAERYGMCYDDIHYLKTQGCLLQMNICDLYYYYVNDTNRMAHELLHNKMFDFIGTDAHGILRRPPIMQEYVEYLYQNYEADYVDRILYKNAMERFQL